MRDREDYGWHYPAGTPLSYFYDDEEEEGGTPDPGPDRDLERKEREYERPED